MNSHIAVSQEMLRYLEGDLDSVRTRDLSRRLRASSKARRTAATILFQELALEEIGKRSRMPTKRAYKRDRISMRLGKQQGDS